MPTLMAHTHNAFTISWVAHCTGINRGLVRVCNGPAGGAVEVAISLIYCAVRIALTAVFAPVLPRVNIASLQFVQAGADT